MELLNKEAVTTKLGVCARTLENLVTRGEFPPPVHLGKRARWDKAVVDRWLAARFAAQRAWTPPTRRRSITTHSASR